MRPSQRRLVAWVTFLAGLYFILDFVVPPTAPIVTRQGVVAAVTEASIQVRNAQDVEATYAVTPDLVLQGRSRDSKGESIRVPLKLRQVQPGDRIDVTVRTAEAPVQLSPGETAYPLEGGDQPIDPTPGQRVRIEFRNAVVGQVDRGELQLLRNGRQETVALGASSLVLRVKRSENPIEIQVHEARVGDTVRVGPNTGFSDNRPVAAQFTSVLETLALGMGLISLALVNGRQLKKREGDWYTALFFFAACAIGVAVGLYKYYDPGTAERGFSDLIVLKVLGPVGSAIFSLLAFYMASAAYRAFRIRTLEAALMMTAALVVMLGQTPFGFYLTGWLGEGLSALWLPNVAGWILRVPNTALFRGLLFGIMLGAMATALRYWLSLERSAAMD